MELTARSCGQASLRFARVHAFMRDEIKERTGENLVVKGAANILRSVCGGLIARPCMHGKVVNSNW
jgi:hypothetical protein